jgi:hypothetical protein
MSARRKSRTVHVVDLGYEEHGSRGQKVFRDRQTALTYARDRRGAGHSDVRYAGSKKVRMTRGRRGSSPESWLFADRRDLDRARWGLHGRRKFDRSSAKARRRKRVSARRSR